MTNCNKNKPPNLSLHSLCMRYDDDGVLQLCGKYSISVAQAEDSGTILEGGLARKESFPGCVLRPHQVIFVSRVLKLDMEIKGEEGKGKTTHHNKNNHDFSPGIVTHLRETLHHL